MLVKFGKLIVGILFSPVLVGYTRAFSDQLVNIHQIRSPEISFLLGVTAYLAFHVLVGVPNKVYIFAHELMHAAASWISGGQVKGFKVSSTKGAVKTNKITAFVALAPYLVPVYAILWALGYGIVGLFYDVRPWAEIFFFGLGVTLTFHIVFTVIALKEKQSDLEVTGPVLALLLITWTNMTLVAGIISLLVPEVRFTFYLTDGLHQTRSVYQAFFQQLFSI